MRAVLSPDDLGPEAYGLILPLLATVEEVVIWRPSLYEIGRLYSKGTIIYGPKEFIKLVENGYVIVGARHPWFDGEAGRLTKNYWDTSRWTPDDKVLSAIWKKDNSLPLKHRRVFSIDNGKGDAWARTKIEQNQNIITHINAFLEHRNIHYGHLRHVRECSSSYERALVLLRDSRNLCNLEQEVGADISLWDGVFARELATIGQKQTNVNHAGISELMSFGDLIEVVSDLDTAMTFASWLKFLGSDRRRSFVRRLAPYINSPDPRHDIIEFLTRDCPNIPLLKALKPNPLSGALAVASIAMSAWGGLNLLADLSIALTVLSTAPNLGSKLYIDQDPNAQNASWLFLLSGKRHITSRDIRKLAEALEQSRTNPRSRHDHTSTGKWWARQGLNL